MVERPNVIVDKWHGLYGKGWTGEIVPEAFSHPAKFSRALIRAIYAHAADEGWLAPGDVVCDPFGGVALGALDAMRRGCHWVGCELEQKFVDLGAANIERWVSGYGALWSDTWGSAIILQGDSRELCAVLGNGAGLCVSSPPFETVQGFHDKGFSDQWGPKQSRTTVPAGYGTHPANLGNMPAGDFAMAVSSPPFGQGETRDRSPVSAGHVADCITRAYTQDRQGTTPGNLAAMSVSSPPWEGVEPCQDRSFWLNDGRKVPPQGRDGYGTAPGQLGNDAGPDFWTAARAIVEQVYLVLRPGGHAVWVTKRFIRKGEIVDFPGQWRELCESVGFVTLHEHRAMLVEDRGAQYDLFGNLEKREIKRASFFRRMYESKYPENAIDWETIHCMVKPQDGRLPAGG